MKTATPNRMATSVVIIIRSRVLNRQRGHCIFSESHESGGSLCRRSNNATTAITNR